MTVEERVSLLKQLWQEQPKLFVHPADSASEGREEAWPLGYDFLRWLTDHLPENACTLETGCGYSTLVMAICGARHTAVAPDCAQHGRIRSWCDEHGVSIDGLRLIDGPSQRVLPSLAPEPLDLVLIDGCHAFPTPFLDWYYTAERIRANGWLVVDDCHLVTGRILADFLDADCLRWMPQQRTFKTVVYQKIATGSVVDGIEWTDQPYCSTALREPMGRGYLRRIWQKGKRMIGSSG